MSGWVRTAAEWFESDDVEALSSDAVLLHLSALALSARQLTNGTVHRRQLRRLWPVADLDREVKGLVAAGWWEDTEDGFYLPSWREHILAADEVEKIREQTRERVERHRRHKADDHSMCDRCSVVKSRNAVSNGVTNGVSNAPPTRTEPNRPTRGGSSPGGTAPADAGPPARSWGAKDQHPFTDAGDGFTCMCALPPEHPIHIEVGR